MAFQAYLSIHGSRQGQFTGNSPKSSRRDKWIEVVSFSYAVQSPREVATGQASGKRQHKPITIVVEQGLATQQMLHALTTNEVLKDVTFEFVDTNKEGKDHATHTVKLTNATISGFLPHAIVTNGRIRHGHSVKIEVDAMDLTRFDFTFRKIEITYRQGGKTASDDWEARV